MSVPAVDPGLLTTFEERLDPARPEEVADAAAVVDYGEISTVLRFRARDDVIFKRMAGFATDDEVRTYCRVVEEYCRELAARGVEVVATTCQPVSTTRNGRVVYLVQPRLPADAMGHVLLRHAGDDALEDLLHAVLERLGRVWRANATDGASCRLGLDGQISNWAWRGAAGTPQRLAYLDVGTPLLRRAGREAMDPEVLLRATPPVLAWGLRHFVLPGVLDRYYSLRDVIIDLAANFIKEGRPDRVAPALRVVNAWLARTVTWERPAPLGETEVRRYYAADARIWTLFQACRRLDRFLRTRVLGRRYDYILPGRFER